MAWIDAVCRPPPPPLTDLDEVVKWLPTNASTALTSPGTTLLEYLPWWAGGLVLLAYAALLAGLGVLLSTRRDIT